MERENFERRRGQRRGEKEGGGAGRKEEEEEERLFIANALRRRRRRRRKVYSKLTQRRDGWAAVCLEVLTLHALLLLPLRCRCSVKRSRQKSI